MKKKIKHKMASLSWCDEYGLLHAVVGTRTVYTWHYSIFEQYLGSSVTPSMYEWMASWVESRLTKQDLWDLEAESYVAGDLEEQAVDEYFEVPIMERINLHCQMLENLEAEMARTDAKLQALDCPFDVTSPIYVEYKHWEAKTTENLRSRLDMLQRQYDEESMWVGGHERGAEDF